ncbi:hypothetical protein [Acinetobacter wanghuae]|uniref:hypothetical protein n=1 Tax=Acinetobacter wanghuae TaxID=2662362 RepID=UPI003AF67144
MKEYQDTETGQIYSFEDEYNPFISESHNIPKTLTKIIQQKPTDSSVWYKGQWIEKEDTLIDYKEPVSSVPSCNPAWMVHLKPYSVITSDKQPQLNFTLDQINSNSYDGMQLSKVIGILSLDDESLEGLISYDGAIAIPQSKNFPTRIDGITKLNEILCCLLLGGIHAEVLHPHELMVGTLYEKQNLFSFLPSLHNQLRCNLASKTECLVPLMYPRVLHLNDLQKAYIEGREVVKSIPTFTPFFLLNGYTAIITQNNNDALNNLWIVVEQLTSVLWDNQYSKNSDNHSDKVKIKHGRLQKKIDDNVISAKHELLQLAEIISHEIYQKLNRIRRARNALAHKGTQPNRKVVAELWEILSDLLEIASYRENIGMSKIKVGKEINWNNPLNTNFDEWQELVSQMK